MINGSDNKILIISIDIDIEIRTLMDIRGQHYKRSGMI